MRLVSFILLTALFISCSAGQDTDQNENLNLQDIAYQWAVIDLLFNGILRDASSEKIFTALADNELLFKASNVFCISIQKFQKSDLYRAYRAIPFSPQIRRSLYNYHPKDIEEVVIISELAVNFRDFIASGEMEKAKAASIEISNCLIRLLIIDSEVQRYIGSSYFNLLIVFVFFIAVIVLLIIFMYKSLINTIKREKEAVIFSHAYMLAQDEERARISRELHDTVIQDMRCVLLEPEKALLKMTELMKKTRDICNNLIPPDFRFSELPDALRQLCLDFGKRTGIDCRAEIDANIKLEFLSMEKRLQIYRIAKEALTNIEKHAEAKEVIVTMRQSNKIIYIGIDDDGKGFISPLDDSGSIITSPMQSGISISHIGIISMKERAAILGGRLKIVTAIDEGALVCLEIPAG